MNSIKILRLFSFLILLPLAQALDYTQQHTVTCQNIPENTFHSNLEYLWNRLILHEIDRYFILICCPIIFLVQVIVLYTYKQFPALKQRPGNIFFGILIIEIILNLRLIIQAAYNTINSQSDPMPTHLNYYCAIMGLTATFLACLHSFYLVLFLLYVIFLFRFSLRKKSETFWNVIQASIVIISLLFTLVMWLENFISIDYDGLCGLTVTDNATEDIVYPCLSLVLALFFGIVGSFTYYYFHKHMPNTEGFQRKKFNDSKIIGMYVVGFSSYLALLGCFSLASGINCYQESPLASVTVVSTISNILKTLQFVFVLYLILKNDHFRYKFKKMLRRFFQDDNKRTHSDLHKVDLDFIELQDLAFNQRLLQIKQSYNQIDLLMISQIYTIISGIFIAFVQYFQHEKMQEIRPIYFLEKTTFLIDQSSVIKYDTEVRMLSKLKILKCNMSIHAPRIFKNLLIMDGLDNVQESFSLFQNSQKLARLVEGKGGKSGQFFFFSADNKFVLKTVTVEEFQFLSDNLQTFYDYYIRNPNSLLAKVYGLFTFKGNQMQRTYRLILMKNILGCSRSQVLRTYDMKGSKHDRKVLKEGKQYVLETQTLKDQDFMELQGKLNVLPKISRQLREALRKDTLFLKSLNLIDYSLLVVRVEWDVEPVYSMFWSRLQRISSETNPKEYYHIGIIDYIQKWDLQKKGEKWWKNLIGKVEVSAEEPNRYQSRFMIFVDEITMNLPENQRQLETFVPQRKKPSLQLERNESQQMDEDKFDN